MNENLTKNSDVDGLLSNYFQAQMPEPWPACQATAPRMSMRTTTRWSNVTRFAVAASVGLLLVGYLALAGLFPRESSSRLHQDPSRNIGHKAGPASGVNR